MKKIKIFKSKLDLNSFTLDVPSILIGRSSVCDQVLIADGIKNIHFLLEWMGEGEFNSETGDWVVYDISDKKASNYNSESMDGVILGNDPVFIGGVYFQIFNDRIQSTDISGLRFSQSVLQQVVDDIQLVRAGSVPALSSTTSSGGGVAVNGLSSNLNQAEPNKVLNFGSKVIEMVRIKSEDDSVVNVSHIFARSAVPQRNRFFPELQIAWKLDQKMDLHFLNPPLEIVNLKTKSQVQTAKISIESNEIIKADYEKTYIIIRFVKEQPFIKTSRFKSEDSFVFVFLGLLMLSLSFFLVVGSKKSDLSKVINTTESSRLVQIQESEMIVPITVPTTIPVTTVPMIQPLSDELSKETTKETIVQKKEVQKKETQITATPVPTTLPIKKPKDTDPAKKEDLVKKPISKTSSAVAVLHKMESSVIEKKSMGLNAPATVDNINQVGLLAKLKNNNTSKNKISANELNSGFQSDVGPSQSEGIKIKSPTAGILDANLNKNEIKDSDLNQARTTLTGSENFQSDNVGPIANADGLRGNLSLGTGLNSKTSLKAGGAINPGLSLNGAKGVSVQGGLTKAQVQEAIARHRREIRTCFESALMIKNNLQGTVMYEWDIRADGTVEIISTKSSDLKSAVVETCVQQIIKDIRFPKSKNGQPTKVFYPFLFQKT